jgi:hypothetical protein
MLFADDTIVLFTHPNPIDFNINVDMVLEISKR